MNTSYTLLGFAIFGGICFAFIVFSFIFWVCYKIYNSHEFNMFTSEKYSQASKDWLALQKKFTRKYSLGQYPYICLKFRLPFPSCKKVKVVSDNDGKLNFGKLDSYEFCLFVKRMNELQNRLNVLQL